MKNKKTLVLGASLKPDRYSHKAITMLVEKGHSVIAIGPLLGLYTFGLFMKTKTVHDKLVPLVCVVSPIICFLISKYSNLVFENYVIDNELIIINGLLTYLGLLIISKPTHLNTRY